jgi:hypothetical protein
LAALPLALRDLLDLPAPPDLPCLLSKLEEVTLSLISTLLTDWGQARPKQTLGELFFDVLLLFSAAVLEALPGERELGRWD